MSEGIRISMPRLSDSMEEGTLTRWLRRDGETVKVGEELAEIETDKATTVYEAEFAGVLKTVIAEGDTVPVGSVIAWLGELGEFEVPRAGASEAGSGLSPKPGANRNPAARRSSLVQTTRPRASPVARRMASLHGIDLEGVDGTGPDGRITRSDVAGRIGPPTPSPSTQTRSDARGPARTKLLSRAQALVAERMSRSRREIPDFEVRAVIDAEPVAALREQLEDAANESIPSINDFVVAAAARALRQHPEANASYREGMLEHYGPVNVAIAVATDDGLIAPTIFDADQKPVGEIARIARDLAARARDGRIRPRELEGATFTVSNLGMFGIESFTAVIPPRQAAILAVGAVLAAPVVRNAAVVPGLVMHLGLSCDHRILYGADAARLLATIRALLDKPFALLA